jgi:hypothetical protein
MDTRFKNLKKLPNDPAARLLAQANVKLDTKLASPASAPVPVVLAELDAKDAVLDMLQLMSVALPGREATWWACLAARDIVGADTKTVPPSLATAEVWVFKPTEENRAKVRAALDAAEMGDDTMFCAMAALYTAGSLGPAELSEYPAPPGGVAAAVLAMNMFSTKANARNAEAHMRMLLERGLDIARGGNGRVEAGAAMTQGEG